MPPPALGACLADDALCVLAPPRHCLFDAMWWLVGGWDSFGSSHGKLQDTWASNTWRNRLAAEGELPSTVKRPIRMDTMKGATTWKV